MKNRFDYGKLHLTKKILSDDTPQIKMEKIWGGVSGYELNLSDAAKLATLVNTQVNILANQNIERQIKESSKEELREKIASLRSAINYIENQQNNSN
jgi:hypothetical protein